MIDIISPSKTQTLQLCVRDKNNWSIKPAQDSRRKEQASSSADALTSYWKTRIPYEEENMPDDPMVALLAMVPTMRIE